MISPYRLWVQAKENKEEYRRLCIEHGILIPKKGNKMKYKIQEHEQKTKEFVIYQCTPNGEVFRRIASCRELKDAENILDLIIKASNPITQDTEERKEE